MSENNRLPEDRIKELWHEHPAASPAEIRAFYKAWVRDQFVGDDFDAQDELMRIVDDQLRRLVPDKR